MRRLRRLWCRLAHDSIMFAGGPTYECSRCGEQFPNPMLDGPVRPAVLARSVRVVAARPRRAKVAAMRKVAR